MEFSAIGHKVVDNIWSSCRSLAYSQCLPSDYLEDKVNIQHDPRATSAMQESAVGGQPPHRLECSYVVGCVFKEARLLFRRRLRLEGPLYR